jgi:hypothetical protein
MDFKRYLAEAERRYRFRVKSVVPLDDKALDKIESAVARYQPLDISRPRKTMLQRHPMDFFDIENMEVYIVDMELALPASQYILKQEIRQSLNVPEKYIVVHGDNDPNEIEGEKMAALADINAEALKLGLVASSALAGDDYPEAEPIDATTLYGNAHNSAFIAALYKIEKERVENRVDPVNPLFSWLDLPDRKDQEPVQPADTFNDDIKDAPRSMPDVLSGKSVERSRHGSMDDQNQVVRRVFTNDKGERVVLTRDLANFRSK